MIISALILVALAIGSAVLGAYASADQGLNHILYWFAVVFLASAGGFLLAYLTTRSWRD